MNELVHIGNSDKCLQRSLYVALALDGLVKIGVTKDFLIREKTLRNSGHGSIINFYTTDKCINSYEVERSVHEYFSSKKVNGEWYSVGYDEAIKLVSRIFNEKSISEHESCGDSKAKYKCNSLMDYFLRNEVPIYGK